MRRFRRNYLDQFYTIDEDSGDYIIEISIKDYDDIFNNWDSSVYNIRDLDTSLKSFLQDCSYDIDFKHKIILRFNIHSEDKDPKIEKTIANSIRNYFRYYIHTTRNRMYEKIKKAIFHICISMMFILASLMFQTSMLPDIFHKVILQGLSVGGWVFLWEAFSVIFIQSSDMRKKRKEYIRLLNAPMKFRYL